MNKNRKGKKKPTDKVLSNILEAQKYTVLGIDQSYSNIGITLALHSLSNSKPKILYTMSYRFKANQTNREKRATLKPLLNTLCTHIKPNIIVCEAIRVFSRGFLSMSYIQATSGLLACIIDTLPDIPMYTIDTRAWRRRVCGKANGDKSLSLNYVHTHYPNLRDRVQYNHDMSDSICIALSATKLNQSLLHKCII